MCINNNPNGILSHYEWRDEKNTLYSKDHKGDIYRFKRNYETLTGTSSKALFVKANGLNGTIYERKIKRVKIGNIEPAKITLLVDKKKQDNIKQFKSNRSKARYEVIGYHFTPFAPLNKPKPSTTSKIDEKPFFERFNHASYRNMLLADMKLIFHLKQEYSIELSELLNEIQMCYNSNFQSPSEIGQFVEMVETFIRTAKTPSGKKYFEIREEEDKTLVYKN